MVLLYSHMISNNHSFNLYRSIIKILLHLKSELDWHLSSISHLYTFSIIYLLESVISWVKMWNMWNYNSFKRNMNVHKQITNDWQDISFSPTNSTCLYAACEPSIFIILCPKWITAWMWTLICQQCCCRGKSRRSPAIEILSVSLPGCQTSCQYIHVCYDISVLTKVRTDWPTLPSIDPCRHMLESSCWGQVYECAVNLSSKRALKVHNRQPHLGCCSFPHAPKNMQQDVRLYCMNSNWYNIFALL